MDNEDLKKVVESALDKQEVPHVRSKKIGTSKADVVSLTEPLKEMRQEHWGKGLTHCAITLVIILVASIIGLIGFHGLETFTKDHINVFQFLTSSDWDPGEGRSHVGAAVMVITSLSVTLLATLVATPFVIAATLFMTECSSKEGARFLQFVIRLLVGTPPAAYGLLELTIIAPFIRNIFGGIGFGISSAILALFAMALPTITSLTVDSLKAVPSDYRKAFLALGATKWQTIYKVVLRVAPPGIMIAVIFGMARVFGEALAVQMAIGNVVLMPANLVSPPAILASQLTSRIGNIVVGMLFNDALWSLALLLLIMSLVFNFLVRLIRKRGQK